MGGTLLGELRVSRVMRVEGGNPGATEAGGPVQDALRDITIVDLSRQMAAPYGTMLLGDYGADVIKIESLPAGDPARTAGTAYVGDQSALFLIWNRNKRSIAVDLRRPEGLEIVHELVRNADVFVENYRPGVADQIGLGYEMLSDLNPRLIYVSVSAFGSSGPYAPSPGTDPVVQALSGVMSVTGEPDGAPLLVGVPMADFTGAMNTAQAVLLGLLARERTGRGQRIEVPMLAGMLFSLTTRLATYWATGADSARYGSAHSVVAPYQAYATADGTIVTGAWTGDSWPRFCDAIERPDLVDRPKFATNQDRVANRDELNRLLEPIFRSSTTADWEKRFRDASALFAEVCDISRALAHPQTQSLEMVQSVEHTTLGEIPQMRAPIFMQETPGSIRRPPPVLGEHSEEILEQLGYSAEQIADLRDSGIVRLHAASSNHSSAK